MKMYLVKINLLLAISALSLGLATQDLEKVVYGSSGDLLIQQSIELAFTVGEPMVTFHASGGVSLSAGFHSTKSEMPNSVNSNSLESFIKVFPNPFTDFIQVETYSGRVVFAQLYNGVGEIILSRISEDYRALYFNSSLPPGIYFLEIRLITGERTSVKVIKI